MRSLLRVCAVSCLAVLIVAGPRMVMAGPSDGPLRVAQQGPDVQKKRAKIRERIRALRAWKLTEELELDQATAARLFPILERYDDKFEALTAERQGVQREIRTLLGSGVSSPQIDKKIDTLIDRMTAQQQKWMELERDRFREVRKVLTSRQAARILIILPAIDRKIERQIGRALRGKAGKGKAGRKGRQKGGLDNNDDDDDSLDDDP